MKRRLQYTPISASYRLRDGSVDERRGGTVEDSEVEEQKQEEKEPVAQHP